MIIHLLKCVVYNSMVAFCVLAEGVPGWTLLHLSTCILFHWVLALWKPFAPFSCFSTNNGASICGSCSLYNSLKWFLYHVCYKSWRYIVCFASLTLSKKVLLKHPILVNMSLNSLVILIVVLILVALSLSMFGPATK